MLTPSSALLWEVWRPLRRRVLETLCVLLFVPALILFDGIQQARRGHHMEFGLMQMSPAVQFAVTLANFLLCMLLIGQAVGASMRQYALPVSVQAQAAVRLFPGALACAGLYGVVAMIVNINCAPDYQWTYLGPALTYGVGYMLMYATISRFRGNETRMGVAGLFVGLILLFWIGGHYGPRWWIEAQHIWPALTTQELVILSAAGLAAWGSLVDSLGRDRRGVGWGSLRPVVEPVKTVLAIDWRPRGRFTSAWTALFWREWRQDGWLVPTVLVGFITLFASIYVVALKMYPESGRYEDHLGNSVNFSLAFLMMCAGTPWFASLTSGPGKQALWQRAWPTSQSTLPISSNVLGGVVMARLWASVLVSALGVAIVGVVWVTCVGFILKGLSFNLTSVVPPDFSYLWVYQFIASFVFIAWMTSGWATAATLSGRRWIALIPIVIIPAWLPLGYMLSALGLLGDPSFEIFLGNLILGVLISGMIAAYVMGTRCDVIKMGTLVVGALVLILTEAIGVNLWQQLTAGQQASIKPEDLRKMMLWLSLAAAPPALIPLATFYNRHR